MRCQDPARHGQRLMEQQQLAQRSQARLKAGRLMHTDTPGLLGGTAASPGCMGVPGGPGPFGSQFQQE